jgi:hypothetical protein
VIEREKHLGTGKGRRRFKSYTYCENNPINRTDPTGMEFAIDYNFNDQQQTDGGTQQSADAGQQQAQIPEAKQDQDVVLKAVPKQVLEKYKIEGWKYLPNATQEQIDVASNLQDKAEDPNWSTSSGPFETSYDIVTPATKKTITRLGNEWRYEPLAGVADAVEKKTITGTLYQLRPCDPATGSIGDVVIQYLDANNDNFIDFTLRQ